MLPHAPAAEEVHEPGAVREALRASGEKYRTLLDSLDEGFCTLEVFFDAGGKAVDYLLLETNPAFERQTGLENAAGKRARELLARPEEFWFETYGRVARTGEAVRFEHEAAELGRFFEVSAFRIGEPGDNRVAVLFNDIFARKRAEANLAFLADASRDLVQLTNIADTMETLGAKIGAHFGVPRVAFAEVDEAQESVTVRHAWKREGMRGLQGVYRISDFLTEDFRRASRAGEIYVVRDAGSDPRTEAEAMAALDIASFVNVPLLREGRWRFQLTVYDVVPRDWRDDEIELMQEMTTRIWMRLERALAEEDLRESEAWRQVALEAANMGTFVWYPQEDRAEPDARMRRIFGLGDSDRLSLAEALARMIHPDDVERYAEAVGQAIDPRGKGRLDTEVRVIHPDRSLRWVAIVAQVVFEDKEPSQVSRMYGTAADITERKRAEERQDFLLNLADTLRPLNDPLAVQMVASRLLAEHLQVERVVYAEIDGEEMVVHRDYTAGVPSLYGRHSLATFGSKAAEEILGGGVYWEEDLLASPEFSDQDKSAWRALGVAAYLGSTLAQEDRVTAAFSAHSAAPRRWTKDEIALVADVAERAWAALERARAETALRAADRRKSEFLAMLGHELRNPLAALEGGVRLLQSPRARPESREAALPIVAQQVAHMKRLIDDVLDLARLDRGKLQVQRVDADLGAILEASIRMTESLAQARGSEIRYLPPEAPLRLHADPERLVQVFSNLLTNALKFSVAGAAVEVWVETGATAVVKVRDYGRGILPEDLIEIFEPFVQSRLSLGLPGAGLGLGLSVSRELVELHGGSILASSAGLDQGSTFAVSLPLPSSP